MKCPTDGTTLTMSERGGIEIDYCPECRGVWLDRGELDKIIERSATQPPAPAAPAAPSPPPAGLDVRAGARPPTDAAGPAIRPGGSAALSQEEEGELAQRDLRLSRVSDPSGRPTRWLPGPPLRRTSRTTSDDVAARVGRTYADGSAYAGHALRSSRCGQPRDRRASVICSKKSSAATREPQERQSQDERIRQGDVVLAQRVRNGVLDPPVLDPVDLDDDAPLLPVDIEEVPTVPVRRSTCRVGFGIPRSRHSRANSCSLIERTPSSRSRMVIWMSSLRLSRLMRSAATPSRSAVVSPCWTAIVMIEDRLLVRSCPQRTVDRGNLGLGAWHTRGHHVRTICSAGSDGC